MLIRQIHLQGIAAGDITLAFRRWSSPTVKAGGTLKTSVGVLAVERIDVVQERDIDEAMAAAAGYRARDELIAELGKRPEGRIYCIHLRLAGPDPRIALREQARISKEECEQILQDLARLDRYAKAGPWTHATLKAIEQRPACRAADLANALGVTKAWLKPQIRKLKELGLTESLEVGYRLSPRGKAVQTRITRGG